MSDIKDRLKFNSGTDTVTKSVADAVTEVLNSGQAPQTRMEKQAALHNYPLQDKPEVAETFVQELEELKKAVNDDKRSFISAARQAAKEGKKTFMFAGKEYPVKIKEKSYNEDNSNDKSDDGDGLDKVQPKAVKKKFKDRKDKDIDNDGDVDSSDKFLHKKRKAISKAIGKDKKEDASELKYDARSKSFKETLRRLGYVKKDSLIYDNKRTGK
jgi:hypothetical protein|tara:strand:+ start:1419 stop:2057 length:639 start_codon:yes stop_codon:yes gene_type:complete